MKYLPKTAEITGNKKERRRLWWGMSKYSQLTEQLDRHYRRLSLRDHRKGRLNHIYNQIDRVRYLIAKEEAT